MPIVRISTSRGHLSDKKQPLFAQVGFTLIYSQRMKNERMSNNFLYSITCFSSFSTLHFPKYFVQQEHKHLQDFSPLAQIFLPFQLRHDDAVFKTTQYKEH